MLLYSCSPTRKLGPEQSLYIGANIKFDSGTAANKKAASQFKAELALLPRPDPNASILGFRYKLFFYNLGGIFRKKLGEPPVLTQQVNFEKNRALLQNRMENRGFFGTTVSFDTATKKKETKVTYHVNSLPRYTIRSIKWPLDSTDLGKALTRATRRSTVKVGDPFDLDVLSNERLRIDSRIKNRGFYYYAPEYLLFNTDTTVGNDKLDFVVEVKPETPAAAKEIYKVKEVTVYADYTSNSDTAKNPQGYFTKEGYKIIDPEKKYKPSVFSRTLVFDTGAIYRRDDHNLSLSRLVDLGVFKFVKVRFDPADTARTNNLNAYYYMTPTKKKSLQAQVAALTKSNNSTGTDFSVTFRNRNLLRGAELLTVSAFVGFEKQVSGQQGNATTIRYGLDANLYIPRAPSFLPSSSSFIAKTRINAAYEIFDRNTQYKLSSIRGSYGWIWKRNIKLEEQANFAVNYVKRLSITPAFQDSIDRNITLARSIEPQFIIGPNYNINYNSQAQPNRHRQNYYFNGNVDLSGFGLQRLAGSPVSNYVRLEGEARHYLRLSSPLSKIENDNMLVSRLIVGAGYAYGSSATMPFIKEFFVGGTNSVRAFRARGLGPGSYYGGDKDTAKFLPDQPGDIKLEANTELRFKIISIVRGAVFVDAGNVWTRRSETARPGSQFTSGFLKDLAVGTGFGLRFDIRLLVLRLDLAFPIRKPYLPDGQQWVLDKIALGDGDWRKQNLILNLAIGYPF